MNDVRMREGNENKKRLKNMRNIRLRWKTFDTMRIMCERNSHLQQIKRRTSEVKEMLIRILDSQTINATGDRQRQEMRPFSYYYDKASHTFMVSSCSHAYNQKYIEIKEHSTQVLLIFLQLIGFWRKKENQRLTLRRALILIPIFNSNAIQ